MLTFEQLKAREGATTAETPKRLQPKQSAVGKVAEFLAPTTKGVLTGEKPLTGRTALGAALEVGSFLIPAGTITKGLGYLGKGAALASKASKVAKVLPKTPTIHSLGQEASKVGGKILSSAKTGAKVTGVSGAMYGAGQGLGDEDASIKEIAGQSALYGLGGAVGGGVLSGLGTGLGLAGRGTTNLVSKALRKTRNTLNPVDREAAVNSLTEAMSKSFVEDNPQVLNKLERMANSTKRFSGVDMDETALLREVVDEGYMPTIDGKLARYGEGIEDTWTRTKKLTNGVKVLAKQVDAQAPKKTLTTPKMIKDAAVKELMGRTDVDFAKALKQLDVLTASFEKEFGKKWNAEIINNIRMKMNKKTKSFGNEFIQDVQNAIATAVRGRLDEFHPGIRQLNGEITKLSRVRDVMESLNNKTVNPGFFASGMGRFVGTVGAASAGLQIAGPGGLVLAGLMAQLGSSGVASIIRNSRFDQKLMPLIKKGLRGDQKLLNKLLKGADKADAALIKKVAQSSEKPKIAKKTKTAEPKASKSNINPSIQEAKDKVKKINKQSGKVDADTLLAGGIATGAGTAGIVGLKAMNKEPDTSVLPGKETLEAQTVDTNKKMKEDKFIEVMAKLETGGLGVDPYNFVKPSGVKALGKALGRYQVTEGELKTFAKRFLGREVEREEFLQTPELQDEYMKGKFRYYTDLGYTPEQIADIHRMGYKNSSNAGSNVYQNINYVKAFKEYYDK